MKISLVEPEAPNLHVFSKYPIPRVGLPILKKILAEQGHDSDIYYGIGGRQYIDLYKSDLVGISTTTSTAPRAYRIADIINKLRKYIPSVLSQTIRPPTVVFGGPHATFLPEEALEHGDYVVRGEGEKSFPKLVDAIEAGASAKDIAGISYKNEDGSVTNNPLGAPAESWPNYADVLVEELSNHGVATYQTARGCPHNCSFCSVTRMFGRKIRAKPINDVVKDLRTLVEANPKRHIFINDDNFAARPKRTEGLLDILAEEEIYPKNGYSAQVTVKTGHDYDLLERMKKANFNIVFVGVESVCDAGLEEVNKHQTVDDIVEAIEGFHKNDLMMHGMYILGLDSDTPETAEETARFVKKHKVDTAQFMTLTPLPGTPVYKNLKADDRLLTKDWKWYDGGHAVHKPAQMTPLELQKRVMEAYKKVYSIGQTIKPLLTSVASLKDLPRPKKVAANIKHRLALMWHRFSARDIIKNWSKSEDNRRYIEWLKQFDSVAAW